MDKEYAMQLCANNTPIELAHNLKKSQLEDCFKALYGIEPVGHQKTKNNLAYACWNFVADMNRTADLFKNL